MPPFRPGSADEWSVLVLCSVTRTHSQGQLTIIHLFWTDVLSGFTAQVSAALLRAETSPSYFSLGRTLLECPWRAALISSVWPYYAEHFFLLFCFVFASDTQQKGPGHAAAPLLPKCSETVMMVTIVMIAATPLFPAGTHRLCGLHCSATFIKSQWDRSIYDCE